MRARAAIVLCTVCLCGWFVGSGLAQLAAPTLARVRPPPLPRVAVAEVVLPDTLRGALFATYEEAPPPPPPDGPDDVACEVPWRLVGTMLDRHRPTRSFAAIQTPEGSRLIAVSMTHAELTLVALDAEAATLARGDGRQCQIRMFSTETTETTITALPELPEPPEHPGVRRVNASHVHVDPSVLDDIASLRVRPIPEMRDGRIAGVRLYGIRRGDPLSAAGLVNGDLLSHVDGTEITSPDIALGALGWLRMGEVVRVTVTTRGVSREMSLSLRGPR